MRAAQQVRRAATKHVASLSAKPFAIRGSGVERRHGIAGPSEKRLELRGRSAIVRGSRRSDLTHAVRRELEKHMTV